MGDKARGFPQKYYILGGFLNRKRATNRNLKELLYTKRNNRKDGRFFFFSVISTHVNSVSMREAGLVFTTVLGQLIVSFWKGF